MFFMDKQTIKLVECPRDAMQGWKTFIPTEKKIDYINLLLQVGFDVIDFGSFVSPKAIPQMADTKEVLKGLRLDNTTSQLLAIVANVRGAEEAMAYDEISFLGFPFSVSETFQLRNTNASIDESFNRVLEMQNLCVKSGKQLVIYLSMGFGNPYGDPWSEEVVFGWADKMASSGIKIISLADTVGLAKPEQVFSMTKYLVEHLPAVEIGVHLHSTQSNRQAKLEAALQAGCYRFDGALKGVGGCPMAYDELVGNMDSAWMINYFESRHLLKSFHTEALQKSLLMAEELFS
jgi:hydroxymethylglutaryl-CoA lyase